MNCDACKNLIIINIYGKLTSSERNELDAHVHQCSSCARLFHKTKLYGGLLEEKKESPLPYWEKSWKVISEKALKKKIPTFTFFPSKKFTLALAAIIMVFILGVFTSKQFFFPISDSTLVETETGMSVDFSILSYAENLELLLIDFRNRGAEPASEELSKFENKILNDLLNQTRLLKYLFSRREDPYLTNLLEDVEVILIAISNLRPGDTDSADQLNQVIREKWLPNRFRQLAQEKSSI